jgi:HEAT repeat protein
MVGRIVPYLDDKSPRVRWESARILANLAPTYPREVGAAIPDLMRNTTDEGTVVRWSAAFALTEIANADPGAASKLRPEFERIVSEEENKGVRRIYERYLKKGA